LPASITNLAFASSVLRLGGAGCQSRKSDTRFSKERPEDIWLGEWVHRLDAALQTPEGLDALYDLMLSEDQHAIDMRSSSPFPGVLTVKERTRVLREFEERWDDGRAA